MQPTTMLRSRELGVALTFLLICGLPLHGVRAEPLESSEDVPLEWQTGEPLDLSTPLPASGLGKPKTMSKSPAATDWNAKVGVDYNKPAIPAAEFRPDQLMVGTVLDQSTGVAWANLNAPGLPLGWDKTAIETRVDPAQERARLGTTLSRSVPVGENFSVTLQNGAAVTRTLANATAATPSSQIWASSQALRFNILPTETTLAFGTSISTADDKWLRSLSAEQKLFGGPISIAGSVSETDLGAASKSLKAGFKTTW
jgi:hypothetical protein